MSDYKNIPTLGFAFEHNREVLSTMIKENSSLDEKVRKPSVMNSNFANLSDAVKIYVMDTITDMAKDVFGPYGGIYGALKYLPVPGKQPSPEDATYIKSKDGHGFFQQIAFRSHYAVTIMKAIQQITKFISGYEDKTSRDGTTSLAMLASIMTKNMIINGNDAYDYKKIPSTIMKEMEEVLKFVGTKLIDDYRTPIYKDAKYLMIGDKSGKEFLIDALKTTTENHPCVAEFARIIDECEENGYDINNMFLAAPEAEVGDPAIELKVDTGVQLKGGHLSQNISGGFEDHKSYVFTMDGFVRPENAEIFMDKFLKWLEMLCGTTLPNGTFLFDGKYNLDAPVIFVTRTPQYMEHFYKKIHIEGIDVMNTVNGQVLKLNIKPKIMLAYNTENNTIFYNDIMEVFGKTRINITDIDRYIGVHGSELRKTSDGSVLPRDKKENPEILQFFPKVVYNKEKSDWEFHYTKPEFSNAVDLSVSANTRYKDDKELELEPSSHIVDGSDILIRTSYDGNYIMLAPTNKDQMDRINEYKEKLEGMKKAYSSNAIIDDSIVERLNRFCGLFLNTKIISRSDDEYELLMSLYEDVLGVFQSGHNYGVMPGANTFFLKKRHEFFEFLDKVLEGQFVECSEDYKKRYCEITREMAKSIITAYEEMYTYIDRYDWAENIYEYPRSHRDLLDVFNVNDGEWRRNILEAARTTRDVFFGALTIAFDMMRLKRIRVNTISEFEEIIGLNKSMPYYAINDQYTINTTPKTSRLGFRLKEETEDNGSKLTGHHAFMQIDTEKYKHIK